MSVGSGSMRIEAAEPAGQPVGRLVSVNVGLPKEVSWQGRTVFTGVFKDPVAGSRWVGRLNVDGDGQGDLAGHGGEQRAVFVYQIDSYRYWERELERNDFVYGQFGENFTVEGLGDAEVCIGDRYQIGPTPFMDEISAGATTAINRAGRGRARREDHRLGAVARVLQAPWACRDPGGQAADS